MRLRFKFRVLPAAILGAGLLLAAKAGALWFELDAPLAPGTVDAQYASLANIEPASGSADAGPSADGAAGEGADAAAAEGGHETAEHGSDATDEHGATGARLGIDDENFDPMMLTRAEIELLQGLSKRRAALEERERDFALKEQTLAAAELRLDAKVKALEELKQTVEDLLKQHDKEEEERLKSLVKIYETMKPKDAASILDGLDEETLLDVIERMKESKTAPIMALFRPDRATRITEQLIARHRLPEAASTQ